MKGRTIEESEWRANHRDHLEEWKSFDKAYNTHQPPSYRLYSLVCPCGASLQCMEELEDVD